MMAPTMVGIIFMMASCPIAKLIRSLGSQALNRDKPPSRIKGDSGPRKLSPALTLEARVKTRSMPSTLEKDALRCCRSTFSVASAPPVSAKANRVAAAPKSARVAP